MNIEIWKKYVTYLLSTCFVLSALLRDGESKTITNQPMEPYIPKGSVYYDCVLDPDQKEIKAPCVLQEHLACYRIQ